MQDGARFYVGSVHAMAAAARVFCYNRGHRVPLPLCFSLVCSLNANIAARVHLRVEGLRLIVATGPVTIY
ncbi:hypothetical protein EV421DRAFT_1902160 [Armillaria borealis]|uniref:Uncharacterized protein n=1 Tax=Armillaria borealis TaxID=47425 RepID=A0AA39JNC1_9AGAR|nr:hypothetical protein EV421DRAFT_1902160 [Armillaria borealis]